MSLFSRPMTVTLEDADTGQVIATVNQKPERLPETFELETTLRLGDDEWQVVEASPNTRVEYRETGRLHLRLRRIQYIASQEILFSLPTICDLIPAVGEVPLTGGELALPDDDWRQLEFVSADLSAEVDGQIEAIHLIHQNHSRNPGWDSIHVRSGPVSPIPVSLSLSELIDDLGAPVDRGLTYQDCPTRIEEGFAFTLPDGLTVYGLAPEGRISVLAIEKYADLSDTGVSSSILSDIARRHSLELVDWPRCARVSPDHSLFSHLLRGTTPEPEARNGSA